MSEAVYLNWTISEPYEPKRSVLMVGSNSELNYHICFRIGTSIPGSYDKTIYDDLLKYSHAIRFDTDFIESHKKETVDKIEVRINKNSWQWQLCQHIEVWMDNINSPVGVPLFGKNLHSPIDYVNLLTVLEESKNSIVTSKDDVRIVWSDPQKTVLGLRNHRLTTSLIYNEKVVFHLRANPDDLAKLQQLPFYSKEEMDKYNETVKSFSVLPADIITERFGNYLVVNGNRELIARDKGYAIRTLDEMLEWSLTDFIQGFNLWERTSSVTSVNMSREMAKLYRSLTRMAIGAGNVTEYEQNAANDLIMCFSDAFGRRLPYHNPKTDALIKELRSKLDDLTAFAVINAALERYNTLKVLEFFIEEGMYNYPLEWSLPFLKTVEL